MKEDSSDTCFSMTPAHQERRKKYAPYHLLREFSEGERADPHYGRNPYPRNTLKNHAWRAGQSCDRQRLKDAISNSGEDF